MVEVIRDETPADHAAVVALNDAAFGQPDEGQLVAALRGEPGVISLVAAEDGLIVGHLLLSPVRVEGPLPWDALALAPMAVKPDRQRAGIGGRLVRASLERARQAGAKAVIVLGHPTYYPRFGFTPAGEHGLTCRWNPPPEAYLVHALEPGCLARQSGGEVRYHPAFGAV